MQSKLCKCAGGAGGQSLPDDIIYEVLLRLPLPPKALRRLGCVCKGWRAIISDPAFLAEQRSRAYADPLVITMFGSSPELELRLLDTDGNVLSVFDVGGTAATLLASTRLDLIFVDRTELGAVIIDPASGHDFTVVGTSEAPPHQCNDPWHELRLRSTAVNDYSFGRAVLSGDYKVLRLHLIEFSSRSRCCGRESSQWCEVGTTVMDDGANCQASVRRPWGPFSQTSFSCEHKATVNGDLYFMLRDTYSASHGRNLIATFNPETDEWKAKTIKGPLLGRQNVQDKWRIILTELKGTLCMVYNVQRLTDFGGYCANLWLLKDPNRSVWVKEFKIEMPERLLFTKPLDVLLDSKLLLLNTFREEGNNEKSLRESGPSP